MVHDVKFISSSCKYRDLQTLLESTAVKTFPLVDSPGEPWGRLDPLSIHVVRFYSVSLANRCALHGAIPLALPLFFLLPHHR